MNQKPSKTNYAMKRNDGAFDRVPASVVEMALWLDCQCYEAQSKKR